MFALLPRHIRRRPMLVAALTCGVLFCSAAAAAAVVGEDPESTWGTNGRIEAMTTVGDITYVGGKFSAVIDSSGHSHPASNLAAIRVSTGAADLTWSGSTNGEVTSLDHAGTTLYVGGNFTTAGGVTHKKVAALDLATGAVSSSFTAGTNRMVEAVSASGGYLYIGGNFTKVTGHGTSSRTFLAKLDATTGAVVDGWSPTPDQRVRAITHSADDGTIYVGGDFASVNGQNGRSTAALSAATGQLIGAYRGDRTNGNAFAPVLDMYLSGSTLYVAAGGAGGACTALDATTGNRVWTKHSNGNMQAVIEHGGVVYCGGHFSGSGSFDGQDRRKIAAVSAAAPYETLSYAPRVNSALGVWSFAQTSTRLFVGGDFTKYGRSSVDHYAVLDG